MRERPIAALGALVLCGALMATQGSAAPSADVTLKVTFHPNTLVHDATVFTGRVSSGAANEVVEVLGRDCMARGGFRLISSGRTRAGGAYRLQNPLPEPPYTYTAWASGMTFQARWQGKLSAPFVLRLPTHVGVGGVRGGTEWTVHLNAPPPATGALKGKVVHLQRLRGRTWTTIAKKPLVFKPGQSYGPYNHQAVFNVPVRGLLRALLPRKEALPCFAPSASNQWRG